MNKKLIIICVVIAVIVLFLTYRQNILGTILPYFIIALCPLMHVFLMNHKSTGVKNNKHDCH